MKNKNLHYSNIYIKLKKMIIYFTVFNKYNKTIIFGKDDRLFDKDFTKE